MSTTTTNLRTAVARSTALRAADGVIAGYIHSLAREAAMPAEEASEPFLGRLVKQALDCYECGASRGSGVSARRRPAPRRVPATA